MHVLRIGTGLKRFGGVRCLPYPQVHVSPQLVHALQVIDEREATQTAGKHSAVSFERVALQFPKVRVRLFHCCCGSCQFTHQFNAAALVAHPTLLTAAHVGPRESGFP